MNRPEQPTGTTRTNPVWRWVKLVAGTVVLLVGIALLVLPGPGLLLVLAGLLILASEVPALERYIDPVQERAMRGMEQSVSSPVQLAGSVLGGGALVATGVVLGLRLLDPFYPGWLPEWLRVGGWGVGAGVIVSGLIVFGLIGYSWHRVQRRR